MQPQKHDFIHVFTFLNRSLYLTQIHLFAKLICGNRNAFLADINIWFLIMPFLISWSEAVCEVAGRWEKEKLSTVTALKSQIS